MIVNNLYLIRAIFFLLSFFSFPIHDNKSASKHNSDRARTLHSELTYINVFRESGHISVKYYTGNGPVLLEVLESELIQVKCKSKNGVIKFV